MCWDTGTGAGSPFKRRTYGRRVLRIGYVDSQDRISGKYEILLLGYRTAYMHLQ